MNILLVLFCLVVAVTCQFGLPPEDLRKIIQHSGECQRQSNATQQEIMATIQGSFSDSPELKNHFLCLGMKLKLISKDGRLQIDTIKAKVMQVVNDESKVDNLMDKCLLQKSTPSDTAYESIKCFSKNRDIIMK